MELDFVGRENYRKCHLATGFDDAVRIEGTPDPAWNKIVFHVEGRELDNSAQIAQ